METFIKPSVCIPVHTAKLNKYEIISIRSHFSKLKNHDIFILIPESKKNKIISVLEKNKIYRSAYKIHEVKDIYLNHSDNFQILMLKPEFYNFYKSYTHILLAQMDAYTFSDQLISWCKKDLHYIGAPCYYYDRNWTNKLYFCGVGGFSLRSIKKTLEVLKKNQDIYKFNDFIIQSKNHNFKGKLILFLKYVATKVLRKDRLRRSFIKSKLDKFLRGLYIFINEDEIYGYYLPKYNASFKVGNLNQSKNFCLNSNVKNLLKNIAPKYPFGAHAWFNYPENLKEWRKHIEEIK